MCTRRSTQPAAPHPSIDAAAKWVNHCGVDHCGVADRRLVTSRRVRGFGTGGHLLAEFVVSDPGSEPRLLELNGRITSASRRRSARNVDFCAALDAGVYGRPSTSGADIAEGEKGIRVFFPGEWRRDPDRPYLSGYPADIPWDKHGLFEALLAPRHGG